MTATNARRRRLHERHNSGNNSNGPTYFEHKIRKHKPEAKLHMLGYNVGNLSVREGSNKYDLLQNLVNKYDFDVLCLTETGVPWHKVPLEQRFTEIAQKRWKCRVYNAWYRNYLPRASTDKHQPGGVSIVIRNDTNGRLHDNG